SLMSRFRPYAPKRPEDRFKYVPGLAGSRQWFTLLFVIKLLAQGWRPQEPHRRGLAAGSMIGRSAAVLSRAPAHVTSPCPMRAQMTTCATVVQVTVSSPGSDAIKERASAPAGCRSCMQAGLTKGSGGPMAIAVGGVNEGWGSVHQRFHALLQEARGKR